MSKETQAETLKRLEVAKAHNMEAKRLTDEERKNIKRNIKDMYEELETLRKSVKIAAESNVQMKKEIIETKQNIRDNEEMKTVFEVKIDNYRSSLQILNMEYKELTQRLNSQVKTNNQLKKENAKLQKTLQIRHTALRDNVHKLETEQKQLEKQLRRMETTNIEMVSETRALDEEIESFQTHKSVTDRSVSRISYEILKMQNELLMAKDEVKRFQDLNAHVRSSICLQEKYNLEKERNLESLLQDLKKKVEEENEKYEALSNEVDEENTKLEEIIKGYEKEKEELLKHEQETIDFVNALEEKLVKLNYLKSQRQKVIESLMQKKKNLENKFDERLQDDNGYLEKLTPYKEMLSENVFYLEKKESEIIEMESSMKTQVKTMELQKNAFSTVTVKLKGNIRKNRISMMNIKTQLQKIDEGSVDCLKRLKETQDRINQLYNQHKELQDQRQKVLKEILEQKQKHLKENTDLASRYRWQQNHLIYLQYCFVQQTDKNLHLEETLNDLRQLLSKQWKVHQNLHNYFQYRGKYNTQKLQQLQHKSDVNRKKAHDLKRTIDGNIDSMTSYIDKEIAESIQRSVRVKEKRYQLPKISTPITG
ncbi:Hypothetical predicted protein [Octopus vulgaris]|uniref:Uncharacterized protein n=1 Tax=Octopus vulgaris TaxID=6645 RepID=A0AA36B035_OCTVU|nr:Hypothetical predicted protein [Octopus vulgaris]